MSSATRADAAVSPSEPPEEPTASGERFGDRARGIVVALLVCGSVAGLAQVPVIRNRGFYYVGDSAAQFLPMWYHLGTEYRAGHWPLLLDVHAWMGGNLAAEALFGTFNPINAANQVLVSLLPDLALAATVVKTEFLVLLALGVHLLAREYGARRWAAAAVAVAVPFAGFTLYFDTAAWLSGLIAFAYLPHVWWSMRKSARGALNPIWPFLIGALAVTAGNPYGVVGVLVVTVALTVEFAVQRAWPAVRRLVLVAVCIGLVVPLVFLTLLGTASVTWRTHRGIVDNGMFSPGLGDLLNLSMPTYRPSILAFGRHLTVPGTYFAWFVLPLLPWLDWRALRGRLRALSGVAVVVLIYLVLSLAPSQVWMFRWPLRVVEYLFVGLAVVFAVVLSAGLRTDHWRRRAVVSGAVLVGGAYLAWADRPGLLRQQAIMLVVLAALTVAAVTVGRRDGRRLGAMLAGGTVIVLVLQVLFIPVNTTSTAYHYPHSVQTLRDRFASYRGTTLQLAAKHVLRAPEQKRRYFLFGSAYLPAGVDSVTAYTGLGFREFSNWFCMGYLGQVCPKAYRHLWRPTRLGHHSMADLLRLKTVVIDNSLVFGAFPEPGWHIQRQNHAVTVLARDGAATRWPAGRLSYAPPGVHVSADNNSASGTSETVRFTSSGAGGTLAFARLNWPGYSASVDGSPVPVKSGPAGLVTVDLPAGRKSGTLVLHWTAPGIHLGIIAAALGTLGAVVLAGLDIVRRRRQRPAGATT
jgi:hypothetical protein